MRAHLLIGYYKYELLVTHESLCVFYERELTNAQAESDPIAQWRCAGGQGCSNEGCRHAPALCTPDHRRRSTKHAQARHTRTHATPATAPAHTLHGSGAMQISRFGPTTQTLDCYYNVIAARIEHYSSKL